MGKARAVREEREKSAQARRAQQLIAQGLLKENKDDLDIVRSEIMERKATTANETVQAIENTDIRSMEAQAGPEKKEKATLAEVGPASPEIKEDETVNMTTCYNKVWEANANYGKDCIDKKGRQTTDEWCYPSDPRWKEELATCVLMVPNFTRTGYSPKELIHGKPRTSIYFRSKFVDRPKV
ncbi:MAG: hypothetical protein GY938_00015, partial [Ketobacter sp.]|nr:hypothetical protein [Ketobacter sp.]